MFTKRLGVVLMAAWIAACTNEDKAYFAVPKVQLKGTNCLKNVTDTVDRYLNGKTSLEEVEAFWACTKYAVRTFRDKVEGSTPGGYKAREFRDFIQRYFLGGDEPDAVRISDELLDELMQIKRIFVGGDDQFISHAELDRTFALLSEFRLVSISLHPYILTLRRAAASPAPDNVDAGTERFLEGMRRIGSLVHNNGIDYPFERLQRLLKLLDELFRKHRGSTAFSDMARWIPLLAKAKGVLFNDDHGRILASQWSSAFDVLGKAYGILVRAHYYLDESSAYQWVKFAQFERIARSAMNLVFDAFARRAEAPIRLEETDALLDEFARIEEIPFDMSLEDIKDLWRVLVDKIIAQAAKDAPGLTVDEFRYLDAELTDWMKTQYWLLGDADRGQGTPSIRDLREMLESVWPLATDQEGRLIFSPDPSLQWNIEASSRVNWLRAIFRPVLRAYIRDPQRREALTGLNREEFDEAYGDLRPFLVALGLIEKDNTTFGDRVFRESDLFTSRANGDLMLNYVEVVEYVHYVLAGVRTGENFISKLEDQCPVSDDETVNADCFRAGFRFYFQDRYAHLPLMVAFAAGLNDKGWSAMIGALELAIRDEGRSSKPVKVRDIYEMGIMLQYIETLMLRFDRDRNGIIVLEEGLSAFPLFKNILAEFMELDPEKDERNIRAVFTYLLKYGEPPSLKKPLSIMRFLWWRANESKWKVNADRGVLLHILAALNELK